jgi:hypothetical protein
MTGADWAGIAAMMSAAQQPTADLGGSSSVIDLAALVAALTSWQSTTPATAPAAGLDHSTGAPGSTPAASLPGAVFAAGDSTFPAVAGLVTIATPPGGVANPSVFGPASAGGVGTSAAPPDLRAPSSDTMGLLNQYLYLYRNPSAQAAAGGQLTSGGQQGIQSQIVQLMAGILGAGSAYYGGYSLAPADVALAQQLNASTPNINLYPQFAAALAMGLNQTAITQFTGAAVGSSGVVAPPSARRRPPPSRPRRESRRRPGAGQPP